MPRLLVMGLNDEDVDVLTHLSSISPEAEVVIFHRDPSALVMKLADVAALPITTELPEPESTDIVVASDSEATEGELLAPWNSLGARILRPRSLTTDSVSPPGEPAFSGSKGEEVNINTETQKATPEGRLTFQSPRASVPPSETKPADPPPDIWIHPEATFRYLVEQAAGADSPVTLWWEGNTGVWVPWLWTGDGPEGDPEVAGQGVEVPFSWGTYRLVGEREALDQLNMAALSRVVEDLALRDLASWRQAAEDLRSLGYPDPGDEAAVSDWADRVLTPLHSEAAMIWRHDEDTWRLIGTWGEGIIFNGDLIFSETLFAAIYENANTNWSRWDLDDGFCIQLIMPEDDPRWPLRLHRVQRAMIGESGGW